MPRSNWPPARTASRSARCSSLAGRATSVAQRVSAAGCQCRATRCAGVPGTAIVMVTLVLSAAGLPLEGIGLLIAIDRILDMMRTMTNVTGQMLVPVLVAKETGLLDRAVYERASSNVGLEQRGAGD